MGKWNTDLQALKTQQHQSDRVFRRRSACWGIGLGEVSHFQGERSRAASEWLQWLEQQTQACWLHAAALSSSTILDYAESYCFHGYCHRCHWVREESLEWRGSRQHFALQSRHFPSACSPHDSLARGNAPGFAMPLPGWACLKNTWPINEQVIFYHDSNSKANNLHLSRTNNTLATVGLEANDLHARRVASRRRHQNALHLIPHTQHGATEDEVCAHA